MGIGSLKVKQIGICVWDLDKAEKSWTKVLGIEPLKIKTADWNRCPSFSYDKADTFKPVDGLLYKLADEVLLEIYGPGEGSNPFGDYLKKYGEGVMNFAFYVPDLDNAYKAIGEVCEADGPYHVGLWPDHTYSYVDTIKELKVQLNVKTNEDNTGLIKKLVADPSSFAKDFNDRIKREEK